MLCICLTTIWKQAKEPFKWLVAKADRQDLEAVKKNKKFPDMEPKFQAVIEEASSEIRLEDRIGIRERRAAIKEELDKHFPTVLVDLIIEH